MKRIVCFGGGNALPKAVLVGLKKYSLKITSITSMVDSGGSTGQLRKDFNVLPPGDIRRHLLALSEAPEWKKELFKFRFGQEEFEGGHKGHSFGNVFLAGLEYILKDFGKVLKIIGDWLEIKGKCLPATIEKTNLGAVLENGKIIFGEDEIDLPKIHDGNLKIKKVFLKPKVKAYPPTLGEIKKANLIVIGPGDLYSSLIPCFLPEGISSALQMTKAKKIFICSAMTKFGETNNFSVLDFTGQIEKYIGCSLNLVFYNDFIPEKVRIQKYKREHPELLELVKINENLPKAKFIGKNLLLKKGPIEYEPKKIAKILWKL